MVELFLTMTIISTVLILKLVKGTTRLLLTEVHMTRHAHSPTPAMQYFFQLPRDEIHAVPATYVTCLRLVQYLRIRN